MPRPRQYATNAEKQEAYRRRHAAQQLPRAAYLAALARSLHGVLQDAVEAHASPLPDALLGAQADETLRLLIRYIRAGGTAPLDVAPVAPVAPKESAKAPSKARRT